MSRLFASSLLCLIASVAHADPCTYDALNLRFEAKWAFSQGNHDKAKTLAIQAVSACNSDAESLALLGQIEATLGDLETALIHLQEAWKLTKRNAASAKILCHIGEIELKKGKIAQATRSAQRALQLAPNLEAAQYLLALCALQQNEVDEASRISSELTNPILRERAQLEEGAYLFESQQFDEAQAKFSALQSYDAALNQSLSNWRLATAYATGQSKRSIGANFGISGSYDSNVTQMFENATEKALDDAAAFGLNIRGGVHATPWAFSFEPGVLFLTGDLNLARTDYFSEPASDFSSTSIDASLGTRFSFQSTRLTEATLKYKFALLHLMGGESTIPQSAHVFSERHGLEAAFTHELNRNLRLRAIYRFNIARFADQRRDMYQNEARLSAQQSLLDRRLKVLAQLAYRNEDAKGRGYSRHNPIALLGVSALLPHKLSATLTAQYDFSFHPDSRDYYSWMPSSSFFWDDRRVDGAFTLETRLTWPIFKGKTLSEVDLEASWRMNDHRSNVERFQYFRHVSTLGVNARFGD